MQLQITTSALSFLSISSYRFRAPFPSALQPPCPLLQLEMAERQKAGGKEGWPETRERARARKRQASRPEERKLWIFHPTAFSHSRFAGEVNMPRGGMGGTASQSVDRLRVPVESRPAKIRDGMIYLEGKESEERDGEEGRAVVKFTFSLVTMASYSTIEHYTGTVPPHV